VLQRRDAALLPNYFGQTCYLIYLEIDLTAFRSFKIKRKGD